MLCDTVRSHDTQLAIHAPRAPTAAHTLSAGCPLPASLLRNVQVPPLDQAMSSAGGVGAVHAPMAAVAAGGVGGSSAAVMSGSPAAGGGGGAAFVLASGAAPAAGAVCGGAGGAVGPGASVGDPAGARIAQLRAERSRLQAERKRVASELRGEE